MGYVFVTVAILISVQKYCLYVNSIIAGRKQIRSRKKGVGVHPQVFLTSYAKFQLPRFLCSSVTSLTHKPTHVLSYLYDELEGMGREVDFGVI
jgi:hypothetical protein